MKEDFHFDYEDDILVQPARWYRERRWRLMWPLFLLYMKGRRRHPEERIFADLPAELFRMAVESIETCTDMMYLQVEDVLLSPVR